LVGKVRLASHLYIMIGPYF